MTKLPISGPPELKYQGRVLRVVEETLTHPTGKVTVHTTVHHPGAVVIIPQQADGSLLVLRQYRHSLRRTIVEFPAGTLDPRESPLHCAQREIQEEVKQRANEWIELGTLVPAPGFSDEVQHCFLARGLSPSALEGDDDEVIDVEAASIDQIERWIADGTLEDGKSIAVFTRARMKKVL